MRGTVRAVALFALLTVLAAACTSDGPAEPPSAPPTTGETGPPTKRTGGAPLRTPEVSLAPWQKPYPYTTPTPPPGATPVDGTYLRVVTIDQAGGPRHGLPIRCLRCIPYRIDAGVATLILFEGSYYVNHQLSGFRSMGHYVVEADRIELFNDANCPTVRGAYRWSIHGRDLVFREVEDACPFGTERADDLTFLPWVRVNACVFRIQRLWPAALGC